MPDTFAVRHPSGKIISFPKGTSDADVAVAMTQLDQAGSMPAPISTATPVGEPSTDDLAKLGEPFQPSDRTMSFAERRLEAALHPQATASSVGQTDPAKAAQALNDSRTGVNLSPQAAAADAETLRIDAKRVEVVNALTASPSLNKYASQSEVHTDAIAPDATNLAAIGQGFFGEKSDPGEDKEVQEAEDETHRYFQAHPEGPLDTISQVLMKHTAGALADFADALAGVLPKGGGVPALGVPPEALKGVSRGLHQASEVDLSEQVPGPVESVVGTAPSMALYAAGGAAGKSALFGTAFAQNYGALKHAGVDDPLAVAGAAAGAAIFIVPGSKFISGMLGKATEQEVREAGVQAMIELAKQPAFKQGLLTYGKHALMGWMMTVGQAVSNDLTRQLDHMIKTGVRPDPSQLTQTVVSATKQSAALLPWALLAPIQEHAQLEPIREYLEQRGQEVAAHADQVKLAQITGPLQETDLIKNAPEEAKKVVQTMADDAGERWANEEQPPPGSPLREQAQPFKVLKREGLMSGSPGFEQSYIRTEHHMEGTKGPTDKVFQDPESKISLQVYDYPKYKARTERVFGFEADPGVNETQLQAKWGKQGRGTAVYMAALRDTAEAGLSWSSDTKRTPASEAMYKSLIRAGVPLRLEDGAYRASAEDLASFFRGPERSSAPGTRAHVDADALRAAAEKRGLDPDKVAEHVTGNLDALREAEATGNPVTMPIANRAVDLGPMNEDLKEGTSLDPTNPSLAAVRKAGRPALEPSVVMQTMEDIRSISGEPPSPERDARLEDAKRRLTVALTELPSRQGRQQTGAEPTAEEIKAAQERRAAGGFRPPPPSKPPGGGEPPTPPGGEVPSPKARKVQAEEAMAGKSLDELKTDSYRRAAQAAQREIDKLRQQVENKLSSAEQTAQQGVDLAVDAAERARQGLYRREGATDAALLNYLRGSEGAQQQAEDKSVRATEKTVEAGTASAEATRHMGIRDTNNALEAARLKALKQANKVQADVESRSSGSTRARLYKAGPIFGQLYDHLMEQLNLRKPEPNAVRDDPDLLMELLQASYGSDMPFDKDHVLDVIAKGKELGSMKLDGAQNVKNFLDTLTTMARESSKAYRSGKLLDREEVITDIERNLRAQNPDAVAVLNPKQAEPPGFFRKTYEKVRASMGDVAKNNFQTLLHALGEWGDSHFLRTLDGEKARARIEGQIHAALEPSSKLPNLTERVSWPAGMREKFPTLTETITRADMLHIRRLTGTMENARDIADATGVPVAAWEAWFDQHMTKEEYEATHHAWRGLEELGKQTAAVHANRGGTPMVMQTPREISTKFGKYQAGYGGGMRWLDNPNELPKVISPDDPMQGNRVASDTRHGLTNTRTPQKYFPDVSATNDRAHFNEQAHDIAFSEIIRDGHRMLNDPQFERAVTTHMGKEWYDRLVDAHNLMANGGRVDVDRGIGVVNALYTLGRVTAGATFPLNVNTMAKMGLHPLQDIAIQGDRMQLLKGVFRAISPEGRLEANTQSRVVGLYTHEGYKRLMQMQRDLVGRSSGERIGDTASMAVTWFQSQIMAAQAHIVWQTHKFGALADGATPQEAIDHADQRTAAAMPANTVLRQSAQSRNAVFASQNLVYNFEGAFWNMKQQQEIERRAGVELEGRSAAGSYALRTVSRLAGYAALGFGLWAGGQGRNPEEERADAEGTGPLGHWKGSVQWVARTMLIGKFFGSPVMHKIMEVTAPVMVGEKPGRHYGVFSPPADELFNATWDDFTKTINSDKSTPERLEAAFRGMARFIPGSVQLSRTSRAAYRLLDTSDFDPQGPRGPFDVFDTLMRGPHPRNASLLSDVQGGLSGLPRR